MNPLNILLKWTGINISESTEHRQDLLTNQLKKGGRKERSLEILKHIENREQESKYLLTCSTFVQLLLLHLHCVGSPHWSFEDRGVLLCPHISKHPTLQPSCEALLSLGGECSITSREILKHHFWFSEKLKVTFSQRPNKAFWGPRGLLGHQNKLSAVNY